MPRLAQAFFLSFLALRVTGAQLPGAQLAANAVATKSASAAPRAMRAVRTHTAIRIDGRLDESAWAAAPVAGDFTQAWPKPGAAATEPMTVRVLYDDEALYVGVRLSDREPARIAAPLARRDASGIYSDWVHVIVDSYHDRRTGFRFSVNPRGVLKDVISYDDRREDISWDVVWQAATSIDSAGWTAEYRIPLSQLRFAGVPAGEERTWGIQVQRDIARRNERDTWAPWTQQSTGFVSVFGDVGGIVDIPVPRRLEVTPYVSQRLIRAPGDPADPFYSRSATDVNAGADLKMGLPRGLTLNATINPDFGQVEVDPAVVNLSAFETFFPERRPFFVEGANAFQFGQLNVGASYNFQQFFYSRRIGRAPQRFAGGAFRDAPDATTILGAAKVSGRSGPWTVGLLDAVTDREEARIQTGAGDRLVTPVEPRTNYAMGRVKREFRAGNTSIGAIATAVNRDLRDTVFQNVLRGRALLGGVDFEHLWHQRAWSLAGYGVGSRIDGRAPVIAAAQRSSSRQYTRPDASHLTYDATRTSLQGHMAELALTHNGKVYFSTDLKEASPGFEVNDMGFQGRVDYRSATWNLGYSEYAAGKHYRSYNFGLGNNNAWNFDGNRIWESWFSWGGIQLPNFWQLGVNLEFDPSTLDDRLTRGGPLAATPNVWFAGINVNSDNRKPVSFSASFSENGDDRDGLLTRASIGSEFRPGSALRITLSPTISWLRNPGQYVERRPDSTATATYGTRYIFGALHQTTVSASTRVEWTMSPTLSLQLYAQPFTSSVRYAGFHSLRRPRAFEFDSYTGPLSYNPAFNARSLRGNAVVRWEYRPGSTVFLVWQQNRSGAGDPDQVSLRKDFNGIWQTTPTNVFMVKASWWLAR